jgi:hypothetical protein
MPVHENGRLMGYQPWAEIWVASKK